MTWSDVAFLHWRVDPAVLRRHVPAQFEIDRFDREAWLSVVPFRMTDIRRPELPFTVFGEVPEINLRTYVRCADAAGVWFFSLDATSPLLVEAARAMTGLPYYRAHIALQVGDDGYDYASDRRDARGGSGRFHARWQIAGPAARAPAESLDAFLHERYRLFSVVRGGTIAVRVEHEPWALRPIALELRENTLGERIGLTLPAVPDRAAFATVVRVRAAAAEKIAR